MTTTTTICVARGLNARSEIPMLPHTKRNVPLLPLLYHATPQKHKEILAYFCLDSLHALCKLPLNLLKYNITV